MGVGDVALTFDLWFHAFSMGPKHMIWRMAFEALLWVSWRIRNRVIFRQGIFVEFGCLEMFCFDLAQ